MTNQNEKDETEVKVENFLKRTARETKCSVKDMINFVFFYKANSKFKRGWHIFEMIIVYVLLQYAWIGIWG